MLFVLFGISDVLLLFVSVLLRLLRLLSVLFVLLLELLFLLICFRMLFSCVWVIENGVSNLISVLVMVVW